MGNKKPTHIAIIMDGNGRWAKDQGLARTSGHSSGVSPIKETIKACLSSGINYLTLFAFSTENWNRPQEEINFLMALLIDSINKEIDDLIANNIKLETIGFIDKLPDSTKNVLFDAIEKTKNNTSLTLVLALNYGSKQEIVNTCKKIANDFKNNICTLDQIDVDYFSKNLLTYKYPDPDILIRTSNEYRLSNFLLFQLAYSELFFLDKFWPDFKYEDIINIIVDYSNRERRYGKTSDQIH